MSPLTHLLEVRVKWRPGRARWSAPQHQGYTDDIARAGLFSREEAEERAASLRDKYRAIEAMPALLAERAVVAKRLKLLDQQIAAASEPGHRHRCPECYADARCEYTDCTIEPDQSDYVSGTDKIAVARGAIAKCNRCVAAQEVEEAVGTRP